MDKVVSTFIQTIRCHWLALLQVHLIFNLLGFAIIGPLFGLLLQTAVGLSGHAVVADQDIARLLLTPLGMSAAVLLAGIFLAILAMEMGALLVIAVAARHGLGITALQASGYAIRRAGGLLLLTLIVTLQVLLRTTPLLIVVGTTAWLLMGAHDINFYLTEKTPQFWWTVAITALALAVYCWLVGRQLLAWCLSLPLVLFGARSGYRALRASRDLVGTEIPQVLRAYVLCIGLAVFIPVIPYVLFDFIGGWIVGTPHTRLLPLFLMLGVLLAVWLVLNFFAVALTLASIASVTASLYSHFNQTFSKDRFQSDVASLPGAAHARRGGGRITPFFSNGAPPVRLKR